MSGFQVPELTRQRQDLASQPRASAWVSANAGSGKTFVLSRRVVRLLLDGTAPSRILALTFTKAAAAEMATRVFKILGSWVTMDDAALADELSAIEGASPDAERIAFARRLFAQALETPGGLKIQTIHGFCEALLHQFPLEANVAGHFTVLDDRIAVELMAEARAAVLHEAETRSDSDLGQSLTRVIDLMSDGGAQKALDELIQNRDKLSQWVSDAGGLSAAVEALADDLRVPRQADVDEIDRQVRDYSVITPALWRTYAEALASGSKKDQEKGERFARALELDDTGQFNRNWFPIFLTKDRAPLKTLVTKKTAENFPDMVAGLEAEQDRLVRLLEERKAVVTYCGTEALLRLAHAVIARYEAAKTARGLLDFEDLVVKTARLLERSDAASWVQYKLDQGLDHILVDEAQDTSPRQWQVVSALAGEFFSGEGSSPRTRTLFAVGDEKQSIYSFQGAVPAYFDEMRRRFANRAAGAQHTFHSVDLQLSFRSTPDVLGAVDLVFKEEAVHRGLSQEVKPPVHEAIRKDAGLVEIWPLEQETEVSEPEDWRAPIDSLGSGAPPVRVARRIADTIRTWIRDGEADAGDIMILVRKRCAFVDILNRELKQAGIPVAGSDRLVLTEHIAVQDLAALGRFLLLSEDDLSLASILKSPLFDLDDEALLEIARQDNGERRPGTLWQSLVAKSGQSPRWTAVRERLETWRARADFMPPFEFFARLLSADGGRQKFRSRLGAEVDDVLDEFLALTLAYEQAGTPGLEGFLAWMSAAPTQIKRELSSTKGLVRVMTVHGSKGLEAKTVILVDRCSKPVTAAHDPAFLPKLRFDNPLLPPALVWVPVKDDRIGWHQDALAELHAAQEEEYRRLLYVALTRAEERIVVCGWEPKGGVPENCWYSLIGRALRPTAQEVLDADGHVAAWHWRKAAASASPAKPAEDKKTFAAGRPSKAGDVPEWLWSPVAPAKRKRRLQPSRVFEEMEEKSGITPPSAAFLLEGRLASQKNLSMERGRIIHRLLELLPDIAPEGRADAVARFLRGALPEEYADQIPAMSDQVQAVLADPDFAVLLDAPGRAEVPVAGQITTQQGEEISVSGQIDRLIDLPDEVLIVDYKTGAHVPRTLDEVPQDYVMQLAVYQALLARVFPGRTVNAALLWTAEPVLQRVPSARLKAVFGGLKAETGPT
ncbi:double-strand break repair helicase AddA [Roseibium aquae]|uniref:DNA 3'-5' helicase n=1 Tax=Roseibium aquae TaxID=1323746 RepID=A0A916TIX1_9HYPH|nr:double-strand break repair helicase AddA [Roseibium aquae]GGB47300.1 double-strand break repair helicase AddA [Roseibium aquae]